MKKSGIVLLLLACVPALAATLEPLIQSARNLKGEFSAEAMLRLAGAPALEAPARLELLALAFDRAADAQQPYKRRPAALQLLGLTGAATRLNRQDMDGLSLRLRAVEAMLPLDAARARGLFARIPEIRLPKLKCDDLLLYDVDRYYDVLASVLRDAPPAEAAPLLARSAAVTSPSQAGPMARVLSTAAVPDPAFSAALEVYQKSLGRIEGDDRSFTAARLLGRDIETLVNECRKRAISPLPLLENYRTYLVIHLSAARCADNDIMAGGGSAVLSQAGSSTDMQAADALGFFNQKLRVDPLKPIDELEATPSRLEGAAMGMRSCQSPGCRAFGDDYRKLLLGPNGQPAPPSARETPEWAARFRQSLEAIASWKPEAGEPAVEHFREKAAAYSEMLALAPAGATRDAALRALLSFLENNPVQKTNRLEWFLPVNALCARTALDPAGYARFAELMRKSADPVIALFAALEQAAPRPPDRLMSVL